MRRRIKAIIIISAVITTLFVVKYPFTTNHNPLLNIEQNNINKTKISPQRLFDQTWQVIRNEYYDPNFNDQYWLRWKRHYNGKIKTTDDAKVAIETMIASLNDPYSRFLSKEEFAEQNSSIASKFSGIGVNIVNDSGKIRIINVLENTPAQFADIKVGDILISVNDKKVSGMSLAEVSNLVKGPVNTFVNINILRDDEILKKKIIRKEITIKTVKSSVQDDIGYIQILSFISNSTPNEFLEALENTDETKGLIIDLRGNTGGLLPNAVFVSNLFLENGRKIVSIVGRNGYHYDVISEDNNVDIKKPVVLLVDNSSASASEIFSGAMKDYKRAKLVGTKTFGKGMVQKIISLPNETGINLTVAKYLTPRGFDINKNGISPDIEENITEEDIIEKRDPQYDKAKELLESMISLEK
ncbi:MAG: S41 family peptidase [Candidatus Gastranaerophilales bacterium]|nr:S41 family peptidase [Candidatus Gastranaerophilales bacterium]